MLTERQQRLIDKCKKAGYGWRKFAISVEEQAFCSFNQEETLVKMWQNIDHANHTKAGNISKDIGCWDSDISDAEAYRGGEYF